MIKKLLKSIMNNIKRLLEYSNFFMSKKRQEKVKKVVDKRDKKVI